MRRSRPRAVTGSLTARGRLSCTQMCARRGRIWTTDPRSGLCFSRTNDRGRDWVNRFPEARDPGACAARIRADPATPAMIGNVIAGGGGSLIWPTSGPLCYAWPQAHTYRYQARPLGLPARTGVLNAQDPTRAPARWGLFLCPPGGEHVFSVSEDSRYRHT